MKKYYIDLRTCDEQEHNRIMELLDSLAWDIYLIANVPKVYEFMWDHNESVKEIAGLPSELISAYPPYNIQF